MSGFPAEVKRDLLAWIEHCARAGEPCPKNSEIAARYGLASDGSAVRLVEALRREGAISVERFQMHRVVTLTASGLATRRPANPAPHWRDREVRPRVATPSFRAMEAREPDLARSIALEADRRGQSLAVFLGELVERGWKQIQAEKEAA